MKNFGVIETTNLKSTPAPGWAYVLDNGLSLSLLSAQPVSRKRARHSALGSGLSDSTAQKDAKLLRQLVLLDRENHREVSVPIPPKLNSEQTISRGSHGKVTSAVRKIIQSNKTFANYLADSEAALAISATGNGSGATFYNTLTPSQVATPSSRVTPKTTSTDVTANSSSRRRSTKKRNASSSIGEITRTEVAVARRVSSPAFICNSTDMKKMEKMQDNRSSTIFEDNISSLFSSGIYNTPTTSHPRDNDPLLVSFVPAIPPESELIKLLAHPPLTYLEARGPLVEEDRMKPVRYFCERCGYWAKVKCVKCGNRLCALECYKEHREDCFKYGP